MACTVARGFFSCISKLNSRCGTGVILPKPNIIMKFLLNTIALLLIISLNPITLSAQEGPGPYFTASTAPLETQKRETWQYMKAAMRDKSASKMDKKRQALISAIGDTKTQIRTVGNYKGDSSLKDALLTYLTTMQTIIKEDYGKIMDLEAIAEQSYDNMEAYLTTQEIANDKLNEAGVIVDEEMDKFVETYSINLIEGESSRLDKKISNGSELMKYNNDMFLNFFKGQHESIYLTKAVESGDVSAMEQSVSALESASTEAMAELDEMKGFEGDKGMIEAVRGMHQYFIGIATDDYPKIVDFHLKKDNMEKLQKEMGAKKKKDITKEDAAAYNKASQEYNVAVKDINNRIDALNKKRQSAYKTYNKKKDEFVGRHGG
jgi:hypothetical protein